MSATLIGNNVTLKVNGAVSASRTSNGTAYTAPTNGYALVNIAFTGNANGSATVTVAGNPVMYCFVPTTGNSAPKVDGAATTTSGGSGGTGQMQIVVGSNQALALASVSGTITVYFSGAEFINSP